MEEEEAPRNGKNETMKRTTIEQRKEGRVVNVLIEIINK